MTVQGSLAFFFNVFTWQNKKLAPDLVGQVLSVCILKLMSLQHLKVWELLMENVQTGKLKMDGL